MYKILKNENDGIIKKFMEDLKMEKITLYKKINYYNKDNFINSDITEKKTFNCLDEALKSMKNTQINYVENKKGVSAYEGLYVIHQTDSSNYVKYNKTINTVTKQTEDNIPQEVASGV